MRTRDLIYIPGDWYIQDDITGQKIRASTMRKTWDGFYTDPRNWNPRQPQDFVRGVKDTQSPSVVRNPSDVFLSPGDVTATML